MVGCHHWFNGHEFEQALGDSKGQRSLVCCSPWDSQRFGHDVVTESLWIPWTAAHQAPLFSTVSWSLLKFMFIESVMLSNHHILCHPFSFGLQSFPASGSFPMSQHITSGDENIETSASATILPMNIQSWFPLALTDFISLLSNGLSRIFSSTTTWKHQLFVLNLLYGSTLTYVHDYWKNHSFD